MGMKNFTVFTLLVCFFLHLSPADAATRQCENVLNGHPELVELLNLFKERRGGLSHLIQSDPAFNNSVLSHQFGGQQVASLFDNYYYSSEQGPKSLYLWGSRVAGALGLPSGQDLQGRIAVQDSLFLSLEIGDKSSRLIKLRQDRVSRNPSGGRSAGVGGLALVRRPDDIHVSFVVQIFIPQFLNRSNEVVWTGVFDQNREVSPHIRELIQATLKDYSSVLLSELDGLRISQELTAGDLSTVRIHFAGHSVSIVLPGNPNLKISTLLSL